MQKENKGITLIALIITIIVMLILVGVTVNVALNGGLFTTAKQATTQTQIEADKEQLLSAVIGAIKNDGTVDFDVLDQNLPEGFTGSDRTYKSKAGNTFIVDENGNIELDGGNEVVEPGKIVSKTVKDNYIDSETNKATVPKGFTVSGIPEEQKISTGLVIYDIPSNKINDIDWETSEGQEEVKETYNQFVWIPVASEGVYTRNTTYDWTTISTSAYAPTGYLPEGIQPETDDSSNNEKAEKDAVLKYNGFYISRYEAGQENSILVSKKDATVWKSISGTDAKSTSKTMYTDKVMSALCSGIQWDMTMEFIDGNNDATGSKYYVTQSSEARHIGGSALEESGQNEADRVCNIYDLEGNAVEIIAEMNTGSAYYNVCRGGRYDDSSSSSYRGYYGGYSGQDYGGTKLSFRVVLYVE